MMKHVLVQAAGSIPRFCREHTGSVAAHLTEHLTTSRQQNPCKHIYPQSTQGTNNHYHHVMLISHKRPYAENHRCHNQACDGRPRNCV
jgi:hypothetical protein